MSTSPSTHTIVDGFIVLRSPICASKFVNYSVWEIPIDGAWPKHSTIMHFDGYGHCGRVGTDPISADMDAMPRSEERFKAVMASFNERRDFAYAMIVRAYPALATTGVRDGYGQIETWDEQAK